MFNAGRRPMGRLFCLVLAMVTEIAGYAAVVSLLSLGGVVRAAAPAPQNGPATTTVSDTVYRADGTPAQGTLVITWPSFITGGGASIAAGTKDVTLGTNGALSVALAPNAGANPAGVYYTVVYQLNDGTSKTEYWLVPTTSPANLAAVRTTPGSGSAAQPVSMQYVNTALANKANDNAVVHLSGTESITGTKSFATPPNVPAPVNTGDVANKSYVDTAVGNVGAGNFLPTAGGTMTGVLTLSGNPVAPLQAAPKQYVDTAFASKADLIGALVPAAELGSGTANAGTCLLGNGTWGACGTGGTGNVSTAPAGNQNITQPVGTQFGVNNVNGVRYVTLAPSAYNWSQSIGGTLTGGVQATVTLSQCPTGIFGTDTASFISINNGAEYVQLQGNGTCVPGSSLKTIKFTPVGSYTNPTLSSASSGIQEALLDAQASGTGTPKSNFKVVFQPTNPPATTYYTIGAAVTVPAGIGDIDGGGASIDCEAQDKCFNITAGEVVMHGFRVATKTTLAGAAITQTACASNVSTITTTLNPPVGAWVDIQWTDNPHYWGIKQVATTSSSSFTYADTCTTIAAASTPGGVAPEHAFIEDNGQGLTVRDIYFDPPGWAAGNLNSWFVVQNDQDFGADGIVASGNANGGLACTAAYCGQAFYGPGGGFNFSIATIRHSTISLGCQGNGVKWLGGGGLTLTDFDIIQGFQQYAIVGGVLRGGFAETMAETVYTEIGGCTNPIMTAAGFTGLAAYNMAGIEQLGGGTVQIGEVAPGVSPGIGGQEPQFTTGGATTYEYWLVVCDGANCSMPMRLGQAAPPNSSAYMIGWPHYASQTGSTVTYWPLRVTTSSINSAPYGTGNWSLVSSAVAQCSGYICTMSDSTATTLQSYSVSINPPLFPNVWNWPGSVILGGGATLYAADLPVNNLSGIVTTKQNEPTVFVNRMGSGSPGVYVTGLAGNSNVNNSSAVGGTVLQNGISAGGQAAGLKGRLNFSAGPDGSVSTSHIITLNDSNPAKTIADASHRPAYDANDVYIGLDQGSQSYSLAQLSLGAPAAISNYIGNTGDGTSWGERLTAGLKEFKVAVKFDNTVTFAGLTGSGSQCLHVSATGVLSGTGVDCGTGSGGMTNPMTAANDMIVGGTGGAPARLASATNSFLTTSASGVPGWAALPVAGASQYQMAMYSASGATVSGDSALTDNGTTLNYSGSGGITAATGTFNGNLTVNGQLLVAGPWMVISPIPGTAMSASGAGTSALGISNDGNFYISANAGTPQKVATTATSSYFSNLFQEDANDVGEYNGTSVQGLNIYGTRTDASDYERLRMSYDSTDSYFALTADYLGTGQHRGLGFNVNGSLRWVIDTLNTFKPWSDNVQDLGTSSLRVHNGYFGTGLITPSLTLNGTALSGVIGTPSANLMTAGTVSGAGQPLCTDGTGNLTITTVGCPPGTGTIGGSGATPQFAYWTNTNGLGAAPLYVTNANTVEQINGTNVQTFNVYGTFTNSSNYERASLAYVTADGYYELQTQQAGTGSQRGVCFGVNNACKWAVDTTTAFKPFNDNARDVGTSSLRVRDFYLGRNLIMSGTATTYNGKATAGTGLAPIYGTVSLTGQTAAIASTTVCASSTCGAGQYIVNYYVDSTVACTTAGSAAASVTIGWTDETTAKTFQVPLNGSGISGGNSLSLGSTANFASGDISLWSAGSANITYATSYTGCTTGTGTYALRVAVRQVQ